MRRGSPTIRIAADPDVFQCRAGDSEVEFEEVFDAKKKQKKASSTWIWIQVIAGNRSRVQEGREEARERDFRRIPGDSS